MLGVTCHVSRGPPEHHVPHGEEVHVLAPELLVLLHVVLDELHQRGGVQLVQPPLVDLLHGGGGGCNNTHLTTTFSRINRINSMVLFI